MNINWGFEKGLTVRYNLNIVKFQVHVPSPDSKFKILVQSLKSKVKRERGKGCVESF